ncbi:MAG: extracellular solute-binding protein [Chloroflexota bacterium]|nr:extracellular solute-binding protein [Chloroflexota bacterium]
MAGCTPQAAPATPETNIVVLWHPFPGATGEVLQTLGDRFNAENDAGLILIVEYQEDVTAKAAAAAPERRPDLVVLTSSYAGANLAASRVTLPSRDRADLLPMAQALYAREGMLPLGLATYVLYYNYDWLKDLGYVAGAATLSDVVNTACAATDLQGGQTGMGIPPQPMAMLALMTAGGDYGNVAAAMTATAQMLNAGCGQIYETHQQASAQFSEGTLSLLPGSSLWWSAIAQAVNAEHNFSARAGALPGPAGPGLSLWRGPGLLLLTPEGPRHAAAQQVMEWFLSPEAQREWSDATHYLPVRRSLVENRLQDSALDPLAGDLLRLTLQAADEETWAAWPAHADEPACRAALVWGLLALDDEQFSPDEVLAAIANVCGVGAFP